MSATVSATFIADILPAQVFEPKRVARQRKEWSPPRLPYDAGAEEARSPAPREWDLTPDRARPGATPELTPEQRYAPSFVKYICI